MKRVITMLAALFALCVAFCLTALKANAATIANGTCGNELTWVLDGDGTLTISGIGTMTDWTSSFDVPWSSYRSSIKCVIIENGVTSIGSSAFYFCTELSTISVADSVIVIGDAAFSATAWYASQPDGLIYVGGVAYEYKGNCSDAVTVKSGTVSISDMCFFDCAGLTSIIIPDSVLIVGADAFYNCTDLFSVKLGDSVKGISDNTFAGCTNLSSITFGSKVSYIGKWAFRECTSLSSVTIPDSVSVIDAFAFSGCTMLKDITFVGNAPTIEGFAFSDVSATAYYPAENLTWTQKICQDYGGSIKWEAVNVATTILEKGSCGDNLIWEIDDQGTLAISGVGTMINWDSYTNVPWYSSYSELINKVIICEGVTSVGDNAFRNCTNLSVVIIPENVISIGYCAFYNCTSLTSVIIPDGVTSVGGCTFYNCTNLLSVFIPDSVTSIGHNSFNNCDRLTTVSLPNKLKIIDEFAFSDCDSLTTITIPNGVTKIGNYAFAYCACLATINISESVTNIGVCTFSGCASLTSVIIPDGVTIIKDYTFENCTSLESVSIGYGVKSIGYEAFYNCGNLTSVTIPNSVTDIQNKAFKLCIKLENVILPNSLSNIGEEAFCNCSNLTSIVIPNSVTTIGNYAFWNCSKLKTVIFRGYPPSIGTNAFLRVLTTCYYPNNKYGWTSSVRQNYGGTITWNSYSVLIDVSENKYFSLQDAVRVCGDDQHLKLYTNVKANVALTKDLYIDLNGFTLSGTINTNGYKIYGMDSTTDGYSCDSIGYFNCVDENGETIIPETHFKSDITGSTKRYMAIKDENGYSFYRFYLGITHQTLKPTTAGVGYKAVFYGDEMVIAQLDANNAFGFALQLEGYSPVFAYKNRDGVVSGKAVTLRLNNYDVERYGETELSAKVILKLSDGTVIESTECTMTMRSMLETLNDMELTPEQLALVKAMIEKYAIIKSWDTENLYA